MKQSSKVHLWPRDYRRLRVGEVMQEGDVIPDDFGSFDPIREGMVGHRVLGKRDGEDFVYRKRLFRRKSQIKIPGGWKIGMKCFFSHPDKNGLLGCRVIGKIVGYDSETNVITVEHEGKTYQQQHTIHFGGISGVPTSISDEDRKDIKSDVQRYDEEMIEDKIGKLKHALEFYDQVMASSSDEQLAVGRDHYEWVFRAARDVVEIIK